MVSEVILTLIGAVADKAVDRVFQGFEASDWVQRRKLKSAKDRIVTQLIETWSPFFAVEMPDGRSCSPIARVYRRFQKGREDSLTAFYQAVAAAAGPGPERSRPEHS